MHPRRTETGVPVGMYRDRRGRLKWRVGNKPAARAYYARLKGKA